MPDLPRFSGQARGTFDCRVFTVAADHFVTGLAAL